MKRYTDKRCCLMCGEIFIGKHVKGLCSTCSELQNMRNVPEPEDKGNCICWHDKCEYKIHECDCRRKLARQRKAENKPYMMPQCGICTEDMPKIIKGPEFEHLSDPSRGKNNENKHQRYCAHCKRKISWHNKSGYCRKCARRAFLGRI